jgi:tetratricopeptide (TPR) repeat protein
MSRSIHESRKSWAQLRRFDFSDAEEKAAALQTAMRRLWKKRRVKNAVTKERNLETPPMEPISAAMVPIRIDDSNSLIQHGASAEDVRSFLETMPPSVTQGISEIHLSLGREYMDERKDSEDIDRDPYFGRLSREIFPGLYRPPILGTYASRNGLITIYAFVWDQTRLGMLPAFVPEFYLRLCSLSVLAHEVAHHHDHVNRTARGRWLSDRKETFEHYAEKMQWEWMRDFVIPYIERRYAQEWQEVKIWVQHHGGVTPTLEQLGGDPRYTTRDGCIRLATSTSEALEVLMKSVAENENRTHSRLEYAWSLHYADEYELCRQITESLMLEQPESIEVLSLHADTLEHMERFDEAVECVEKALALDATCENAWKTKAFLMADLKKWEVLVETCDHWINRLPNAKKAWLAYRRKAVGLCALGRFEEMETAIALGYPRAPVDGRHHMRRLIYREAGMPIPDS